MGRGENRRTVGGWVTAKCTCWCHWSGKQGPLGIHLEWVSAAGSPCLEPPLFGPEVVCGPEAGPALADPELEAARAEGDAEAEVGGAGRRQGGGGGGGEEEQEEEEGEGESHLLFSKKKREKLVGDLEMRCGFSLFSTDAVWEILSHIYMNLFCLVYHRKFATIDFFFFFEVYE